MPIRPRHSVRGPRPLASRQFTDRADFIAAFRKALAAARTDQPRVLVYYGVGGIGKTSLRRQLQRLLETEAPDARGSAPVSALLDFDVASYRDPETALFILRKTLHERFGVAFPTFDIASATYWQRIRPQTPITEKTFPLLEHGEILTELVRVMEHTPGLSLIPCLAISALKGSAALQRWWTKRGNEELRGLAEMEPPDIAARLPMFWASDLHDFLADKQRNAVLFLDTYETLTTGERGEGRIRERDAWVRELVAQLPEVLWVVCGREQLRWAEIDADWAACLDQHLIGGLAETDALGFLTACGIEDPAIRQLIVASSQGVPYFLDLAVDTWLEISERREREPSPADFAHTPLETFDRFLRHLTREEAETLKVLSAPRSWTYPLFKALVREFQTGYPLTAFTDLCRFSFVEHTGPAGTEPATCEADSATEYRMHQLMRQSLQEHQAPELRRQLHRFMFDHYARRLASPAPDLNRSEHRAALVEAAFHGMIALAPGDCVDWFAQAAKPFITTYDVEFLIPLAEPMAHPVPGAIAENDPARGRILSVLGAIYRACSKYAEAESYYTQALKIAEQSHEPGHVDIARALSGLGGTLREHARAQEAEPLLLQAAKIQEQLGAPVRLDLAQTLNDLGGVYLQQNRFGEDETCHRRALAIREEVLGPEHPDVMKSLNNLAVAISSQGRSAEAEPILRRLLEIAERQLGPDSYMSAVALLNLSDTNTAMGNYGEAEQLGRRALALAENWGRDDIIAGAAVNLAEVLLAMNRPAEAEPFVQRSLAIAEIIKSEGTDLAYLLGTQAQIYYAQGRLDEAEAAALRARAILENRPGARGPNLIRVLTVLARIGLDRAQFTPAEDHLNQALSLQEGLTGPDHPDVARLLELTARLHEQTGRTTEAGLLRERIRRIRG